MGRVELQCRWLVLYRLDWIDRYPVHRHITRVDEPVPDTARYQNRITCSDGVFLAAEHQDACAFGDERLMFPFVGVIGTSLARGMLYVEHYVTRNAIVGSENGVRASLFVTYYGFHSSCLAVFGYILFCEEMILNRIGLRIDCRDQ